MARSVAILLLLLSGMSTELLAQGPQLGQVAGRVKDATGGALAGVTGASAEAEAGRYGEEIPGSDPAGRPGEVSGTLIPGAIDRVMSVGVAVDRVRNLSGSIRLRHFGPRPLIEDGSVRSKGTSLVNAQLGYRVSPRMTVTLDAFNLLNTRASDVDYYYTSRLLGEPSEGVDDVHTHPALPRTARVTLRAHF